MRHDSLIYVYSNFINKSPLYTLYTYSMVEYWKWPLKDWLTFPQSIHIYICQSCDCHIFSLVTVLGNMYNLCELHSLICMCSNMHSGCHSLSKCTFLYNYRYKYGYEILGTSFYLANNMASSGLRKMLAFVMINSLGVLVLVCTVILCGHGCSSRCYRHGNTVDTLLCMWQVCATVIMLADVMPM